MGALHSFRARILLLVLVGALVPLGLVGWWLTRAAARSGEDLLRLRLRDALERTVTDLGPRWLAQRSALLAIAESQGVQQALTRKVADSSAAPDDVAAILATMDSAVARIDVRDATGVRRWALSRERGTATARPRPRDARLRVSLEIFAQGTASRIGALDAWLDIDALLTARSSFPFVSDAVITVLDSTRAVPLVPVPFDAASLRAARFLWAGEEWLTERRVLEEPRLELVAAAPLTPFILPFTNTARRGLLVLLAVSGAVLALTILVTARMTGTLRQLAASAEAVTRGDLSAPTPVDGRDEVARVARAFNLMTLSLRRTLADLAQREALAELGTFASQLAHEVRNPLSAIRVDLQLVEEQLPEGSALRSLQHGALDEIERLNGTVSGVLQLARSGRIDLQPVDLAQVVRTAARTAQPAFDERDVRLEVSVTPGESTIQGDAGALRQVVLNLLVNAAQSLAPGGRAHVELTHDVSHSGGQAGTAVIVVRDGGDGIPAHLLDRVREPFFSSRAEGTGLGLAIADRIVRAHGATMEIASTQGEGTTVQLRFPMAT